MQVRLCGFVNKALVIGFDTHGKSSPVMFEPHVPTQRNIPLAAMNDHSTTVAQLSLHYTVLNQLALHFTCDNAFIDDEISDVSNAETAMRKFLFDP